MWNYILVLFFFFFLHWCCCNQAQFSLINSPVLCRRLCSDAPGLLPSTRHLCPLGTSSHTTLWACFLMDNESRDVMTSGQREVCRRRKKKKPSGLVRLLGLVLSAWQRISWHFKNREVVCLNMVARLLHNCKTRESMFNGILCSKSSTIWSSTKDFLTNSPKKKWW